MVWPFRYKWCLQFILRRSTPILFKISGQMTTLGGFPHSCSGYNPVLSHIYWIQLSVITHIFYGYQLASKTLRRIIFHTMMDKSNRSASLISQILNHNIRWFTHPTNHPHFGLNSSYLQLLYCLIRLYQRLSSTSIFNPYIKNSTQKSIHIYLPYFHMPTSGCMYHVSPNLHISNQHIHPNVKVKR